MHIYMYINICVCVYIYVSICADHGQLHFDCVWGRVAFATQE